MIHATELLSEFAYNLKFSDLPKETVETTKLFIADYFAACFAGKTVNTVFNKAVENVIFDMGGKEESSVLFSDRKLPSPNAAFMNAVYAHGADMDDGNRKAMGHIGAHVLSAVFAVVEVLKSSGEEIITAINVGYDVYNRVAAAVQPGLVHRGFHSTGTAGAIACAAAAGKLMGFTQEEIYNAMSLAAIQASGLIIIAESGQSCKPINPANAAKTGILSAKIIAEGVKSSVYPLESDKGFFHAMSNEVDESMITDGLCKKFTIDESYLKPYPSCRHTHCGIEAVLKIRDRMLENGAEINSDNIKAVKVFIYNNAIKIAGKIEIPQTPEDSKFSIHYSLAVALLKGHFNISDLDISDLDSSLEHVINATELIPDESMENRDKGIRGAKVEVELADGQTYCETVLIPKGDSENPFTWADMYDKMNGVIIDGYNADVIMNNIRALDKVQEFTTISMFFEV